VLGETPTEKAADLTDKYRSSAVITAIDDSLLKNCS